MLPLALPRVRQLAACVRVGEEILRVFGADKDDVADFASGDDLMRKLQAGARM